MWELMFKDVLTDFRIVTNSAPMATWFTVCTVLSPGGFELFLEEAIKCTLPGERSPDSRIKFDLAAIPKNPYIQGVWKEALRTGSASAAARVVVKDTNVEGYLVKKGSVVLIPVHLLHFNPEVFEHPEQIKPQRWIVSDEEDEAEVERIRTQNLNLRSFGGGTGLCSGRFVAELEIISLVSSMLLLFDVEFVTSLDSFKLNPRSIGIMGPETELVMRLRRKKFTFQQPQQD